MLKVPFASQFLKYKLFIVVLLSASLCSAEGQNIDPFLTCAFVKRHISQNGRISDRTALFTTYGQIPGSGVLMLSRLDGETAFIIHNSGSAIPFQKIESLANTTLLNRLVNPAEKPTDPDAVLIAGVDSYNKGGQFWLSKSNFKEYGNEQRPQTDFLFQFINDRNGGILYQDQSTNDLNQYEVDLKIKNSEVTLISCQALF